MTPLPLHRFPIFMIIPVMLFVGSCSTAGGNASEQDKGSVGLADNASAIGQNTGLKARTLGRGECGLFVWSAEQNRRFMLFSQSQKDTAVWASPNGEQALTISQQSGQVYQEQYSVQTFAPIDLTLVLRDVETVIDSTRFKGGTLSLTEPSGLQRIMPVVALSTCR